MNIQEHHIDPHTEKQVSYFQIARHILQFVHPPEVDLDRCLPSFSSFVVEPILEPAMLSVELTTRAAPADDPDTKLLSDISVIWEERFRFEETSDHYVTTILAGVDERPWKMISTKDFKHSVIYAQADELYTTFKAAWLLMIAFGQAGLQHQTILLHASVVERNGVGYAFLGKSGTGKSTHSRLWVKHIEGTQLMNDDNPVVRVYDNAEVFIYGTPWSGKTPCYKPIEAKLGAVVRLEQAPYNKLQWQKAKEALIALLPSGSAIRWNPELFDSMLKTLEVIIQGVPIGYLRCLPDRDAAALCFAKILEYKAASASS
ncbi:hypothetical protein [Sphingobacterium suaedae]|uniref:Phosphoenolpyruvate carboxykinase n=1 Tax=Sphingobacterium suaedae TaxID=1686402 RepID=A0ABW5KLH3_9SPHI